MVTFHFYLCLLPFSALSEKELRAINREKLLLKNGESETLLCETTMVLNMDTL